jgi:hypothetical protein
VRETVEFRRLCVRAILHGYLKRHERHSMIFKNDDLKAIGKYVIDELRLLRLRSRCGGTSRL